MDSEYNYNAKLTEIASALNIPPDVLRLYLYEALDKMKQAVFIEPKITQIEHKMGEDGAGVYYCLIEKLDKLAPRPRTISDFIGNVLQGVYQGASENGYSLLYKVNHVDLTTPDYFESVLSKHPNAGVLMLIPQKADMLVDVCLALKRTCLIIDYVPQVPVPIHTLNVDNHAAVYQMTHKLIELGHRRIAFITGFLHYASALERFEGYKVALNEAGIPFDPTLIGEGNWGMALAHDLTMGFLRLNDRPTAIVCSNDQTALGVYGAIKEHGLKIPQDISVVGFDDIPIVANIDPPLATVRQSMSDLGHKGVMLLLDAMEGKLTHTFTHTHPLELKIRESMGKAPY